MLLKAENIQKEYGIQEVFDLEKVTIEDGDRIGLVGRNGTGKSTLLGVLSGRIAADAGSVTRYCEVAEILQDLGADGRPRSGQGRREAWETAEEAERVEESDRLEHAVQTKEQYISRLGIRDSALKSGGEKMRLAIAEAFSRHTPLLFADEPTTNLDLDGVLLLEKMMRGYRGGMVLVSHDRKLLDDVCNQIWELEDGALRVFDGNYSAWVQQKERERNYQQFEYEQYRKEKKRLERSVSEIKSDAKAMKKTPRKMSSSEWMLYKGIASQQQKNVSNRGSAMKSRLTHLETKERPTELPQVSIKGMHTTKIKAKYAAKAENLTVEIDGVRILHQVELLVESGKKTFLIGRNGTGKSTLLRALVQKEAETFLTEDAKVGYFSQNLMELMEEKTVLENVLYDAAEPEYLCRAVLANLYMSKADLKKRVNVLSGGERVKTALAKLLVSGANFFILDEPTNHMDIYTMEGLERMLADYEGTILAVSHDRHLVEKLADVVYEMKDERCIRK